MDLATNVCSRRIQLLLSYFPCNFCVPSSASASHGHPGLVDLPLQGEVDDVQKYLFIPADIDVKSITTKTTE